MVKRDLGKTIKKIVSEKSILDGFAQMALLNPETKMFYKDKYLDSSRIDNVNNNIYWSINGYIWNRRIKRDLTSIYVFGIDIDSRKNGISDKEVFKKLDRVYSIRGIYPRCINKTHGGFHVVYKLKSPISYKLYENLFKDIYEFLNEELGGDKKFTYITGILKVPGAMDVKNNFLIKNIHFNLDYSYDISVFINIINSKYRKKYKVNLKNEAYLLKIKERQITTFLNKNIYFDEINKIGALSKFNIYSDDIEIKNRNGLIDILLEEGKIKFINNKHFIDGTRIQINEHDNTIIDWSHKDDGVELKRSGVFFFLRNYIFKDSVDQFKDITLFISKHYGINFKQNFQESFSINRIIFDIITSDKLEIDTKKIISELGSLNEEFIEEIKSNLFNSDNGLNSYRLHVILNVLYLYYKDEFSSGYRIIRSRLETLFKSSYMSKSNLRVHKKQIIKIINYLRFVTFEIDSFNKNENSLNISNKIKLNIVSFFENNKSNETYKMPVLNKNKREYFYDEYSIELFGGFKKVYNYSLSKRVYLKTEILLNNIDLNLYFMLYKIKYLKKSINISNSDLGFTRKQKFDNKSKIEKILKKYFKNNIVLTIYKDCINLAYKINDKKNNN